MNKNFTNYACATNCAQTDRDHPVELAAATKMLRESPSLSEADIFSAAICGNESAVRRFVERDPDATNRPGGPRNWTPLLYLCFSRFLRDTEAARVESLMGTARFLLESGADPNAYFMLGDERETALYAACGVCNNAELARMLLEAGAEVNDEDATYHVAEFENPECIGVLFDHRLDADRRATVLLRKLDFEDLDGVRFILDHGGDVNHCGRWGKSPLHQAIMRGRSLECIRLLVERGADVNAPRKDGATPWFLAWLHGRGDVASFLQKSACDTALDNSRQFVVDCARGDVAAVNAMLGVDPDIVKLLSRDEQKAIIDAARAGNRDGLATMLDAGFDIAITDNQGFTPLHWAAWYGHVDCVTLLIDRGAPLELENNYGGTVVDGAVWGWTQSDGDMTNGERILQLLADAGADLSKVLPRPVRNERIEMVLVRLMS